MKTITFSKLKRLSFINKPPSPVVVHGKRMEWVGIGWIDCGKPTGSEKWKVIEDRKGRS